MLTDKSIRRVNYYINHCMEQSILKVENLSHRYSVQWAIRDINFEITQNGVYGLLGSNGAGKSTTMNIICGVLKQTEREGAISFMSKSITQDMAYRQSLMKYAA